MQKQPSRREYVEALKSFTHMLDTNESVSHQLVEQQMLLPATLLVGKLVYWGYRFNADRNLWEAPPAGGGKGTKQ